MNTLSVTKRCLVVALAVLAAGCTHSGNPSLDGEKVREYANALYNNELYIQAVSEYQRYLDMYTVPLDKQANIWYTMGNIYFERMQEYENALAYYLKVKTLCPDSPVMQDVNKRIVACLERLQRSSDAKMALDNAVNLSGGLDDTGRPGSVVAKVGEKEITQGDLTYYISRLPGYARSSISDTDSKKAFLVQYIAAELFFDAAKRAGYEQDKDVLAGMFEAKKNLMVQKYLQKEMPAPDEVSREDVELYYKAHKQDYAEKDDKGNITRQKRLDEVAQQAANDLLRERQTRAYNDLLQRMMQAEDVTIYEKNIK